MNAFIKLFKSYPIKEIFTPTRIAKLNYLNRNIIESDLERYIEIPGKQIILYGHSGSGKTTLLRNKLKELKQNFIRTHCESNTTLNDLLLSAFDELNRFYISQKTTFSEYTISSELKAEYGQISNSLNTTHKVGSDETITRICPPQLTPQKLAQFLGEINSVWLIEDFHKVQIQEKTRIADIIKIFIDASNDYDKVKIICVGAVGTARELVELDNNLSNRVAEIYVPLISDKEISKIIKKGFDLINVKIENELAQKIVYYSNNLASISHQICYDLCYFSKIKKTKIFQSKLKKDVFKESIKSYVRKNSDTFKKIYDKILQEPAGWYILKTFENLEKESLTYEEIKRRIPNNKIPIDTDIVAFLHKLCSEEYNEIIRFDISSNKYSFSSPFFKAFLKMQLALELSEQNASKNKRNNKKNNLYSIDDKITNLSDFDTDIFYAEYSKILDNIIEIEIKQKNK